MRSYRNQLKHIDFLKSMLTHHEEQMIAKLTSYDVLVKNSPKLLGNQLETAAHHASIATALRATLEEENKKLSYSYDCDCGAEPWKDACSSREEHADDCPAKDL